MWLLRFHFAISVLCLITFIGFGKVCKEQLRANGWKNEGDKKKGKITAWLIFFVPIMNLIAVLIMFVMISAKKSDFDKAVEENKKEREESE